MVMASNTTGHIFTLTTAGESHGAAMSAIIDGCPAGLGLSVDDIQKELDRRRPGQSKHTSARKEADVVEILSGVFEGVTTGMPISLLIRNQDQRSRDYDSLQDVFRPGHADYTYYHKYGIRDHRGGGRASARETAMWVAAGAIAKKYLAEIAGISICGYLSQIGEIVPEQPNLAAVGENPFFFPDMSKLDAIDALLTEIRRSKDSIGAKVSVVASNVPVGLGEPVFDKLDAEIAKAMMSINAAKGVEIGDGFAVVNQKGSAHRDAMRQAGFQSNHAGGVLGGISTGQDILVSVAFKPTSSIPTPIQTITTAGEETNLIVKGRHDPCVGIRAVPIVEARLAMVLLDHYLLQKIRTKS